MASDGTTITWNAVSNPLYNNDIAGIGRDDCTDLNQKQSKSVNSDAVVTMGANNQIDSTNAANGANLADMSFLVWGNDNGSVTGWNLQDISITGSECEHLRINREWRFQETGDAEDVLVRLDVDDAQLNIAALPTGATAYYLYIDNDGDFTNGGTEALEMTNSSGSNWEVTLSSGTRSGKGYFTFGTQLDAPFEIALTTTETAATEAILASSSPRMLTVQIPFALNHNISVDYATVDGTATAADGDFTNITATTLTINAGMTTGTFGVTILNDADNDADETFTAALSNPQGACLSTTASVHTFTIIEDEPLNYCSGASEIEIFPNMQFLPTGNMTGTVTITGTTDAVNDTLTVDLSGYPNAEAAFTHPTLTITPVMGDSITAEQMEDILSSVAFSSATATGGTRTLTFRVNNGSLIVVGTRNVMLNLPPSAAVLSGGATICSGNSADLVVTITGGTGPYSVVYSDGVTNFTVSPYTSGANIPVSPTTTTTYTLVSAEDNFTCAATSATGTALVTVIPGLSTNLSVSDATICNPATGDVNIVITNADDGVTYELKTLGDVSLTPPVTGVGTGSNLTLTILQANAPTTTTTYLVQASRMACAPANLTDQPTVTVEGPIAISTQPANATECSGSGASFSVTATNGGSGTLAYQWQVSTDGGSNWNNVTDAGVFSGATTATLNISDVAGFNTYQYRVQVSSSACANVNSNAATLTVEGPVAISVQPISVSECSGNGAAFTATATNGGGGTLAYQWQVSTDNGTSWTDVSDAGVYTGSATTTLTISNVAGLGGNQYRIQASTTECADVNSSAATLTVEGPVTIMVQPVNETECAGNSTSFTVTATNSGSGTLAYQWQVSTDNGTTWNNVTNAGVYSGATTATLNISDVTGFNTYQYRAAVTTAECAAVNSNAAILTVEGGLTINTQPSNASECSGGSASFTVAATAMGTITYQWQVSTDGGTNWTNVTDAGVYTGATTATLNISNVTGLNGNQYRVQISTATCAALNSNAATLNVEGPVSVTTHPINITECSGSGAGFSVVAANGGAGTLAYQWQVSTDSGTSWNNVTNAGVYTGATTANLSISNVAGLGGNQYRVQVSTAECAAISSNAATLTVEGPIAISGQPGAVVECAGNGTTFTVAATNGGSGTLAYQWQVSTDGGTTWVNVNNGGVFSGATTTMLSISDVVGLSGYQYRAVVTTAECAAVNSNAALLTEEGPITITTQPTNATVCAGSSANFTAAATNGGAGTLTYQWQVSTNSGGTWANVTNGGVYSDATTTTLSISDVTGLGNNWYRMLASSAECAPVPSNPGILTVEGPINITTQPISDTECSGNSTSFTVAASNSGSGSLVYQWQVSTDGGTNWTNLSNGAPYSGVTTTTLAISDVTGLNSYQYRAQVSTANCPAVASNAATLTVESGLTIVTQPASDTDCIGNSASFTVAATATGTIIYQWQVSTDGGTSWSNHLQRRYFQRRYFSYFEHQQ